MTDWTDSVAKLVAFGGGTGGGYIALKTVVQFFGGRLDKREAAVDAGSERLNKRLEDRLDKVEGRLDVAERELALCERKHALSEVKAARLEAMLLQVRPGLKLAFPPEPETPASLEELAAELDKKVGEQ